MSQPRPTTHGDQYRAEVTTERDSRGIPQGGVVWLAQVEFDELYIERLYWSGGEASTERWFHPLNGNVPCTLRAHQKKCKGMGFDFDGLTVRDFEYIGNTRR